jgi:protein O-GlcNAc transferase
MSRPVQIALERLHAGDRRGALAALPEPADAEEHAVAGMVHLAAGDWAAARAALATALGLGEAGPVTLLNLALAEDRLGLDGRARMRAVAALWPQWDEPRLRLAESFRRAGDESAALAEYARTLALNPDRAEALLAAAVLHLGREEVLPALPLLLRLCALAPDHAEAWDALGIARRQTGDPGAAEAAFAMAQRLRPAQASFALRRGDAAYAAGGGERELARLEEACVRDPLDIVQMTARGALLHRLGRLDAAADVLGAAAALAPDAPAPAAALAACLVQANRMGLAVPALRRAAALAPDDFILQNNLAVALTRIHSYREARELLDGLVAAHGARAPFLCNLANALVCLGLQDEGVEVARRATERAPGMHLAWRTLAGALTYAGGASAGTLRALAERAAATLPRGRGAPPVARDPERRLRLGLLSATLKTHPVGWLTVAGFETLDPRAFEIVCLGQEPGGDALQRRFAAIAAGWHVVTGKPAEEVAATVRDLGIDVLIDLSGWGDQGMLAACAERPAPLQIKWVGMQAHTTGMAEIDCFLTDRWETPPGFEPFYTERLLRMPDGYVVYSPPPDAPDPGPLPAATRRGITFGCLNNLAKITPRVIATWAAILRRVPDARLLLKAHQFSDAPTAERIRAAFAAHGIAAARLELRGSSSLREQLAQHRAIDIVLDPFPYTGGLTTCEALWMGVPVLALAGESFAGRHSTSHLSNAGLADWIAADTAEYAERAVAWAADRPGLARLRATLRAQMAASPLCDAPRFGRHLGAALRGAWRAACVRP